MPTNHQKSIQDVFSEFKTGEKGLANEEAKERLEKYGPNVLKKIKQTPLIFKFFNQFKDVLVLILIFAGFLAYFVAREPRDSIIIFIIVVINAAIGFIQEYRAEKILAAFTRQLPAYAKVVRDGKLKGILVSQIVPGDLLFLEAGDKIPADAAITEEFDLQTNEFSLTGESLPQDKKILDQVFMGTSAVEGEAKAVVTKTGMETEYGKIAEQSQRVKETPTPLQKELTHIGNTTIKVASVIMAAVMIIFYFIGKDIHDSLLFAIAAAVAIVPEGLPAATSIALSLGSNRMLKKKALVKKLLHVESLGSVTVICTDKTGTLTAGRMKVVKSIKVRQKEFFENLILCNNASTDDHSVGDPLEQALLDFAREQKYNIKTVKNQNKRIFEIPFSAETKMMTVVCQTRGGDCPPLWGTVPSFSFTKGAPVEVINLCRLSAQEKNRYLEKNDEMSAQGLRVLALASKKIKPDECSQKENLLRDLDFLGLVGLEDPPRSGVKEAIRLCRRAKINVIMITGDYGLTARSIGEKIGLVNHQTKTITGDDLRQMDDEKLKFILRKEVIFARTNPGQKLRIVKNLQEMGEVVAVTGDGVNDAPALVKADIGVAMGKIGTDVAKEAADMILLDDHFATIVKAIEEGRRIYENVKKFVFYTFSSNSGELFVALFGILAGLPAPLLAVQILAIDLGTDVFPSLALGMEEIESGVMEKEPRSKFEKVMTKKMLGRLLFIGLLMAFLALGVYLFSLYWGGWRYGQELELSGWLYMSSTAAVYITLVFCQAANAFSSRSEKISLAKIGFLSNRWLLRAELISIILLFGIINWPPLQKVFHTAPPVPIVWLLIFFSFFIFLWLAEWQKKRMKEFSAKF